MAGKKKSSSLKKGSLKDLYSPKFLLLYVVFFAAVYFLGNSFAAVDLTNNFLTDFNPDLAGKVPGTRWTTTMNPQNGSMEGGRVVLLGAKGQTKVILRLNNQVLGTIQPAHIHAGSCPNPGSILYPLTNVVDGLSVTTINLKLSDLQKMAPLSVNVHKSPNEPKVYLPCGDLR